MGFLSKLTGKGVGKILGAALALPTGGASLALMGSDKPRLGDPSQPADFIGKNPQGAWVNNQFATSRDEKTLRPEDIWGYHAFTDKIPSWMQTSEANRRAIAQKALDLGLVREARGDISIAQNPDLDKFVSDTLAAKQRSSSTSTRSTAPVKSKPSQSDTAFSLGDLLPSPNMPPAFETPDNAVVVPEPTYEETLKRLAKTIVS